MSTAPVTCHPGISGRDRRNAGLNIAGEFIWGFQSACVAPMTVLTLLLRHYGAGERMLGSLTAIESGLVVLPQMLGLYLFRSLRARKQRIVIWHLCIPVPLILLMGAIVLTLDARASPAVVRWLLLGCYAALITSIGIIVGVWMDWLAHLFHTRIRGTVMGLTFFAAAIGGTAGGALAGRLLTFAPDARTYGLLYLGAGLLAACSIGLFGFVDDPADDEGADDTRFSMAQVLDRFRHSLGDLNFRNFLLGRFLTACGFCVGPFIALHYQSAAGGGLSDGTLVTCGASATLTAALANIVLGRIGDKHGHRIGIIVGALAQVLTLVLLLTGQGLAFCILTYAAMGICGGAGIVSHNNMLFETCPHDHRLAHITVGNLVMAGPLLTAPLLAGWLAEAQGLRMLFGASLAVSVLATVWLIRFVRDPREELLSGM
ncbi:MAG: MFS transporter [Lentisphaerae bacterium]|nr:MFS transporter [Lentisphaerota bacterium]